MPAVIAPLFAVLALLGNTPAPLVAPRQQTQEKPATPPVEPVPLPDVKLSDADYKTALSALLADPIKRPGVFLSLTGAISRDEEFAHPGVILELMTGYLTSNEPKEVASALRILGRLGKTAQPLLAKVLSFTVNPEGVVRAGACEALGGMYYAPPGTTPTCPVSVTRILVHLLETDTDRETERAAAVALGRTRVVTPEVITALSTMARTDDYEVALGAVNAAMVMGPAAHDMLPALKVRLADPETVNNTAPAIMKIATPQETVDAFAEVLTTTSDLSIRKTIAYYAGQLPKTGTNTTALATALKPLMDPLPASTKPVTAEAQAEDPYGLRVAAAKAYFAISGDVAGAATGLSGVVQDTAAPVESRRVAVLAISDLGKDVVKVPAVLPAMNTALSDPSNALQGAAVNVLFKFGGPAAKSVAPKLSELLLAAWEKKENARVYSLINAIYRIGPAAKTSAAPVLKKIIAGEPKNSANGRYAQIALEKVTAAP